MPNGNVGTFQRAVDTAGSFDDFSYLYRDLQLRPQELRKLYEKMKSDALYLSEFYQVAIDKDPPHGFAGMLIWHLSIKRLDKETIFDWRDLQAIKSQLCGAEAEAVQLMPAESRVVDTSNQFHLYVFMKQGRRDRLPRVPLGWSKGMKTDDPGSGARQRPREETAITEGGK